MHYHSRVNWMDAKISEGVLGNVTRECIFSSAHDRPFQYALRDIATGRVELAEQSADGSILFKNLRIPGPPSSGNRI